VFYEGHLPAFAVNTLIKLALGRPGIDEQFETLFARGIDPADEATATSPTDLWPSRADVQAYAREAEAMVGDALADGPPEAAGTVVEHELMHQETLLYMFHNMAYDKKRRPPVRTPGVSRQPLAAGRAAIPAGVATLGAGPSSFGWDNEFPRHQVDVEAFEIDRYSVTNGDYLEDVEAGRAHPPHFWMRHQGRWHWRGMFDLIPLPLDWPVWVRHEDAVAYAGRRGARLPAEAEYHRAAGEHEHPWGDEPPDATRGNFDFAHWDPVPAGSYPAGASASGVHDLVGNGWEWTASEFAPFDGFKPMWTYPQYSTDFFDGKHFVLKGASPATARDLIRRSFRNWFRGNYPYVFAKFRTVRVVHP
jgi:formylglycine-generating enzyme required for sulfatase activity